MPVWGAPLGVFSRDARQTAAKFCANVARAGLRISSENISDEAGSAKSLALNTIASISDLEISQNVGSSFKALIASDSAMKENLSVVGPNGFFDFRSGC